MNQVRPGAYIDFQSVASSLSTVSTRGIALLPLELNFLEPHTPYIVNVYTDFNSEIGISIDDPSVLPIKEALKNAETVIIYRVNSDVLVENQTSDEESDDAEISNIQATSSASLDDYTTFFNNVKTLEFNTFAITSTDASVLNAALAFTQDMRENEGRKIQCVVSNATNIDYEGVINVTNGVVLSDGTEVLASVATCYVAGATAGAEMYESLTHATYLDAVDVSPKFTNTEIATKLSNGEFIFTVKRSKVVIEQDINSFTDLSPTKGSAFSKNRVIRILDTIATDIKSVFEDYYLGKVTNNATGRGLFASECISYLRQVESLGCIESFTPVDDITVLEGTDTDSIYVDLNIKPVDSIEKLYMTVYLN